MSLAYESIRRVTNDSLAKLDFTSDSSKIITKNFKERELRLKNVNIHGSVEKDIPDKKVLLLSDLVCDLRNMSLEFEDSVQRVLVEDAHNPSKAISVEQGKEMIYRGYTAPHLSIYDGNAAEEFLRDSEYAEPEHVDYENGYLAVFNFAPPLDRFWRARKGNIDPAQNIEWGRYYLAGRNAIWRHIKMNKNGNIKYRRSSSPQTHERYYYYYLWEVTSSI